MSEREKVLRYYQASGDNDLAAKLFDLAEMAIRNQKYKVSDFLDPYSYSIAETVVAHSGQLSLLADGGYPGAERVKAAFIYEDFPGKVEFSLAALSINYDSRYYHLSHRDLLGALIALGLKRDVLGDIIVGGQGFQVIVDTTFTEYIIQNLGKVGAAPVSVMRISPADLAAREERIKEIKTTVSSLRLDVVAAAGFGTSRTKMANEIELEKVKVNWKDAKSSSQPIKNGDVISFRGRGRVEVCEILGNTKKGRVSIYLKRYL